MNYQRNDEKELHKTEGFKSLDWKGWPGTRMRNEKKNKLSYKSKGKEIMQKAYRQKKKKIYREPRIKTTWMLVRRQSTNIKFWENDFSIYNFIPSQTGRVAQYRHILIQERTWKACHTNALSQTVNGEYAAMKEVCILRKKALWEESEIVVKVSSVMTHVSQARE